jgi:hypothetical protein
LVSELLDQSSVVVSVIACGGNAITTSLIVGQARVFEIDINTIESVFVLVDDTNTRGNHSFTISISSEPLMHSFRVSPTSNRGINLKVRESLLKLDKLVDVTSNRGIPSLLGTSTDTIGWTWFLQVTPGI